MDSFTLNPTVLLARASAADASFQSSLHISAALAGIILLVFLDYRLRTGGYLLSRSCWRASDSLAWIFMGLITGVWTSFIFVSAYLWEGAGDMPCRIEPGGPACGARLAFAPWILIGAWLWWFLRHSLHRIRGVVICRLSPPALKFLEWKIRRTNYA